MQASWAWDSNVIDKFKYLYTLNNNPYYVYYLRVHTPHHPASPMCKPGTFIATASRMQGHSINRWSCSAASTPEPHPTRHRVPLCLPLALLPLTLPRRRRRWRDSPQCTPPSSIQLHVRPPWSPSVCDTSLFIIILLLHPLVNILRT